MYGSPMAASAGSLTVSLQLPYSFLTASSQLRVPLCPGENSHGRRVAQALLDGHELAFAQGVARIWAEGVAKDLTTWPLDAAVMYDEHDNDNHLPSCSNAGKLMIGMHPLVPTLRMEFHVVLGEVALGLDLDLQFWSLMVGKQSP